MLASAVVTATVAAFDTVTACALVLGVARRDRDCAVATVNTTERPFSKDVSDGRITLYAPSAETPKTSQVVPGLSRRACVPVELSAAALIDENDVEVAGHACLPHDRGIRRRTESMGSVNILGISGTDMR
jgi:hypothetical protein